MIKNIPLVSVVVVAKNEEKNIKKCINSLLNLNYPNFEIIAVDNNSSDNTLSILQAYRDKIKTIFNIHPGPSSSRNVAIKYANGDYIAFTDSDCIVHKDWLNNLMKIFNIYRYEKLGSVGGKQEIPIDETAFGRRIHNFFQLFAFLGNYFKQYKCISKVSHNPSCNVVYKRDVFKSVGLFREDFWPGEDVEFDYRLTQKGFLIFYTPDAIVYHYRPENMKKFKKMMYKYGASQAYLILNHGLFRKLHYIAILFLVGLIIFFLLMFFNTVLLLKLSVLILAFSFIFLIYFSIITGTLREGFLMFYMAITANFFWFKGFLIVLKTKKLAIK